MFAELLWTFGLDETGTIFCLPAPPSLIWELAAAFQEVGVADLPACGLPLRLKSTHLMGCAVMFLAPVGGWVP